MKRENAKKRNQPQKAVESTLPDKAVLPEPSPEEQKREMLKREADRLAKVPEYFAKLGEFQKIDIGGVKYHQAIDFIRKIMEQEEWFAENTPYPFKVIHLSRIAHLAFLTCGHLKKIALADNNDAIEHMAFITVELTETLTELLTVTTEAAKNNAALTKELKSKFGIEWRKSNVSNAELMKSTARHIPYWPMLRFLNTSANSKKQFLRIAEHLELGKQSPINVSKSANYSLETPINAFVWKCLRHFQNVHWLIQDIISSSITNEFIRLLGPVAKQIKPKEKTFEEAVEHLVLREVIKREEIQIYKESGKLPTLTKNTAQVWADKAIMPYVKIKFPDLRRAPELSGYKTGPAGKRYAPVRKAVIQALMQMARKA